MLPVFTIFQILFVKYNSFYKFDNYKLMILTKLCSNLLLKRMRFMKITGLVIFVYVYPLPTFYWYVNKSKSNQIFVLKMMISDQFQMMIISDQMLKTRIKKMPMDIWKSICKRYSGAGLLIQAIKNSKQLKNFNRLTGVIS